METGVGISMYSLRIENSIGRDSPVSILNPARDILINRERVVEEAMESTEGRIALGQSMVEPIKRAYVGSIPIRQDIAVVSSDSAIDRQLGWVIFEEIGICVINDYAIAKIEVRECGPFLDEHYFSPSYYGRYFQNKSMFSQSFSLPAFYGNRG
jgi:hypothetical protein